eukprot:10296906-Alexandrium_andersonii.AAC.1
MFVAAEWADVWRRFFCGGDHACTVQKAVQSFRKEFRECVHVHVRPEQHRLFDDARHARLRGLGFWSIVGSACRTPRLGGEAWRRVWSM